MGMGLRPLLGTRPAENTVKRPRPLKVAEAAEQLGLRVDQVYTLIRQGHLPALRIPGRTENSQGTIRIEAAELDRFMDACRQAAT